MLAAMFLAVAQRSPHLVDGDPKSISEGEGEMGDCDGIREVVGLAFISVTPGTDDSW